MYIHQFISKIVAVAEPPAAPTPPSTATPASMAMVSPAAIASTEHLPNAALEAAMDEVIAVKLAEF